MPSSEDQSNSSSAADKVAEAAALKIVKQVDASRKKSSSTKATSAVEKGADVSGQKVKSSTTGGGGEDDVGNVSESHHSMINVDQIVIAADKTSGDAGGDAKKGAVKEDEEFLNVFLEKGTGTQSRRVPLLMEVCPMIVGPTSLLNFEGSLIKQDKKHPSVRGDCYFILILFKGQLEGRPFDAELAAEQDACIRKIHQCSRRVLELMFEHATFGEFREVSLTHARLSLKAEYMKKLKLGEDDEEPSVSQMEKLESKNPDLEAKMLKIALKHFISNKTQLSQFPGNPSDEEKAAGKEDSDMLVLRHKVWPFAPRKFNKATDSRQKYVGLAYPKVPSDMANWPKIHHHMTTEGRRVYSPIKYYNGKTGSPLSRLQMSANRVVVNEEGEKKTVKEVFADPSFNPLLSKVVDIITDGVKERKTIDITSLVQTFISFRPYIGPKQYGVRLMLVHTVSTMDHVPRTPKFIKSNAKWARDYNEDDVQIDGTNATSIRPQMQEPIVELKTEKHDDGSKSDDGENDDNDVVASGDAEVANKKKQQKSSSKKSTKKDSSTDDEPVVKQEEPVLRKADLDRRLKAAAATKLAAKRKSGGSADGSNNDDDGSHQKSKKDAKKPKKEKSEDNSGEKPRKSSATASTATTKSKRKTRDEDSNASDAAAKEKDETSEEKPKQESKKQKPAPKSPKKVVENEDNADGDDVTIHKEKKKEQTPKTSVPKRPMVSKEELAEIQKAIQDDDDIASKIADGGSARNTAKAFITVKKSDQSAKIAATSDDDEAAPGEPPKSKKASPSKPSKKARSEDDESSHSTKKQRSKSPAKPKKTSKKADDSEKSAVLSDDGAE